MMTFDIVDVFADGRLSGNPLAVVHGAQALESAGDGGAGMMLELTRWLGFSETTFLLPPTDRHADYRVRIFYPAGELPFAGHPTLGSAAAWLAAGGKARHDEAGRPVIIQECAMGLIPVRPSAQSVGAGASLAFRAPPMRRSGPLDPNERAEAIRIAGVDEADVIAAVHADNGPAWRLLHCISADAVLAARPVPTAPVPTDVGLVGKWSADDRRARGRDFEVRAVFADANGRVVEDPVTGSLNAGVAHYLLHGGHAAAPGYVAGQGRCIGRDGRIVVAIEDDVIWIGGAVEMIAKGAALTLPGVQG